MLLTVELLISEWLLEAERFTIAIVKNQVAIIIDRDAAARE